MRLHPTALTLMTLMLAACGGSDKSSSGSSGGGTVTPVATARDIIVTPALGVVTQGKVTVKSLDGTPIDTQFILVFNHMIGGRYDAYGIWIEFAQLH